MAGGSGADLGRVLQAEVKRSHQLRLREPRKLHFIRATVVGLAAGLLAVAFQWALFAAEAARDSVLARLHAVTSFGFIVTAIVGAGLCGVAGWMLARYAPAASGSGIPHIKGVLLRLRVLRWRTVLPVKFLGGVLCIGSGMSLGREGPTVQLGAAVGQAASEFLHVPRRSRKHLI